MPLHLAVFASKASQRRGATSCPVSRESSSHSCSLALFSSASLLRAAADAARCALSSSSRRAAAAARCSACSRAAAARSSAAWRFLFLRWWLTPARLPRCRRGASSSAGCPAAGSASAAASALKAASAATSAGAGCEPEAVDDGRRLFDLLLVFCCVVDFLFLFGWTVYDVD